jgi:hypothetical protein
MRLPLNKAEKQNKITAVWHALAPLTEAQRNEFLAKQFKVSMRTVYNWRSLFRLPVDTPENLQESSLLLLSPSDRNSVKFYRARLLSKSDQESKTKKKRRGKGRAGETPEPKVTPRQIVKAITPQVAAKDWNETHQRLLQSLNNYLASNKGVPPTVQQLARMADVDYETVLQHVHDLEINTHTTVMRLFTPAIMAKLVQMALGGDFRAIKYFLDNNVKGLVTNNPLTAILDQSAGAMLATPESIQELLADMGHQAPGYGGSNVEDIFPEQLPNLKP